MKFGLNLSVISFSNFNPKGSGLLCSSIVHTWVDEKSLQGKWSSSKESLWNDTQRHEDQMPETEPSEHLWQTQDINKS
jgi:hypothetical protein